MMAHVGLSVAFGTERLQLDDSEGEKLAAAVEKVARHYDIPDVASETKDWIGLIICAGTIYGSRFAAWKMEKMAEPPPENRQSQDNKVVAMPGALNHAGPVQ